MDEYLKNHVTYLKDNLGTKGFLNLSHHLQHLSSRKQQFLDRQRSIETDMTHLDHDLASCHGTAMASELGNLQKEIDEYNRKENIRNRNLKIQSQFKKINQHAIHF